MRPAHCEWLSLNTHQSGARSHSIHLKGVKFAIYGGSDHLRIWPKTAREGSHGGQIRANSSYDLCLAVRKEVGVMQGHWGRYRVQWADNDQWVLIRTHGPYA